MRAKIVAWLRELAVDGYTEHTIRMKAIELLIAMREL